MNESIVHFLMVQAVLDSGVVEHVICRSDAYAQLYSAPEIARGWQNRGKSSIIN